MSKFRFRWYLDEGLFVVLVMAAALASAALEVGALVGAFSSDAAWRAQAASASAAKAAAASAVGGSLVVSASLANAAR